MLKIGSKYGTMSSLCLLLEKILEVFHHDYQNSGILVPLGKAVSSCIHNYCCIFVKELST